MLARPILSPALAFMALSIASLALAQDQGNVDPKPHHPLANPNYPKMAAKELFARKRLPAAMPVNAIGTYSRGCIAGAARMPITGDTWQVMRLSRNRNWGHPALVTLLKRLSEKA